MIDDTSINPFHAAIEDEFPHTPLSIPNWTEFYLAFAYDPVAQLGVWVHIGRDSADSSIWRATIHVFLPDGELLVGKYYGRNGHQRGPGAGPLLMNCLEPMRLWEITFDGMLQRTCRSFLVAGLLQDSPAELVKFRVFLNAASPFAMHPRDVLEGQAWAHFHNEQVCNSYGEFTISGESIPFQGVGARDHSCGPRDYTLIDGDMWLMGCFPSGKCILAQYVRIEGKQPDLSLAYIFHADGTPLEKVELLDCPIRADLDAPPGSVPPDPADAACRSYKIVMQTRRGCETIEGEILHGSIVSAFSPFHELIGTAYERADANQMCESPTRLRWNDEVGYGLRERGLRVNMLQLPRNYADVARVNRRGLLASPASKLAADPGRFP